MRKQKTFFFIGIILVLLFLFSAVLYMRPQTADTASDEVAIAWFELQLDIIKSTPGYTPPVVARVFGYTGVALYEAVLPGMNHKKSILDALGIANTIPDLENARNTYNWSLVANSALAEITYSLFPETSEENNEKIAHLQERLEQSIIMENNLDADAVRRAHTRGQIVAKEVFEISKTDGGHAGFAHNFTDDYEAPTGEGLWVTTPPDYQSALQPFWGENMFFVASAEDDCRLAAHPEFSVDPESEFYKEAIEVYDVAGNLSSEENEIALFWADDPGVTATPPGHWVGILSSVLQAGDYSLSDAAEIYARLGIALSDSFISCWKEKYTYNLIRPITYIQENIDATWNTPVLTDPVITPPFPEYPSGHSVQSGAAATVLTDFFGDSFSFVDDTHEERGYSARSFASFNEAAEEAAISRLYGGIHYRSAIDNGVDLGNCIGEKVNGVDLGRF